MLKKSLRTVLLCVAAASLLSAEAASPANIAGQWQFTVELAIGTGRPLVTFRQEGEKITGTYEGRYGKSALEGTVKDLHVEFTVTMVAEGTTVTGAFAGDYEKEQMAGTVEYEGAGEGTWSAVRVPAKK